MSKLSIYILFGFCFVLAAAMSVTTMTSVGRAAIFPDARYCFHRLYTDIDETAQVLLIGSSRIWLGVDPDQLARELNLPEGAVINLAHTHRDYDFDRSIVDVLTSQTPVDLVLFDTLPPPEGRAPIGSELRTGDRLFGAYYVNGSGYGDLFGELLAAPRGVMVRLHDMVRAVQYRHQRMVPLFVGGRVWQTLFSPEFDQGGDTLCWNTGLDRKIKRVFDPEKRRKATSFVAGSEEFLVDTPDYETFGAAHRDMAALGPANGHRTAFIFAPSWAAAAPEPAFLEGIEGALGVPYLSPPAALISDLKAASYSDRVHLNGAGRAAYTSWLAQAIKDEGLLAQ